MSVYDYDDLGHFEDVYGDLDLTALHPDREHLVFVYGTLMTGRRNHTRLQAGARLVSRHAVTRAKGYQMFCRNTMAGYYAPVVTRDRFPPQGANLGQIRGEVYRVDNDTLTMLDVFEGHPEYYRRQKVAIADHGDIWMYLFARDLEDVTDEGITFDDSIYRWVG